MIRRLLALLIKSAIISTLEDNPPKAIVDSSVHLENNEIVMTILDSKYREWVAGTCRDVASKIGKAPDQNVVAQYGDDVCLAVPDEEAVVVPKHSIETTGSSSRARRWRHRMSSICRSLYDDMTSSLRKAAAYIVCMISLMACVSLMVKNHRMNNVVKEYGILKPVLRKSPVYGPFIQSLDSALKTSDIDEVIEKIQSNR